ncbi:hypothetical protein JCM8208_002592 [Rhodotorula glutinis]
MFGSSLHPSARPPSFSAADDARRWNLEVASLRAQNPTSLEDEIRRRERLVFVSQQLAEATVRQQEDVWAREHSGQSALWLQASVFVEVGKASEPIERLQKTERDLSESVDRLQHEASRRQHHRVRAVLTRSRPIQEILADLHRFSHLLGDAMGQLAYQKALRDAYMTFSRHLQDVQSGRAVYNPPPVCTQNDSRSGRLSIYGEIPPGEEGPPAFRSQPTLQELASAAEREEVERSGPDAWRRLSSTSGWSEYAGQVAGSQAGPSGSAAQGGGRS